MPAHPNATLATLRSTSPVMERAGRHSFSLEKPWVQVLDTHQKLSLLKILLHFIELKTTEHLQIATHNLVQT